MLMIYKIATYAPQRSNRILNKPKRLREAAESLKSLWTIFRESVNIDINHHQHHRTVPLLFFSCFSARLKKPIRT